VSPRIGPDCFSFEVIRKPLTISTTYNTPTLPDNLPPKEIKIKILGTLLKNLPKTMARKKSVPYIVRMERTNLNTTISSPSYPSFFLL